MNMKTILRTLMVLFVLCLTMTSAVFADVNDILVEVSWPEGAETSELTVSLYETEGDAEPIAVLVLDGAVDEDGEAAEWKGILVNDDAEVFANPVITVDGEYAGYAYAYEDGVASIAVDPVTEEALEEPADDELQGKVAKALDEGVPAADEEPFEEEYVEEPVVLTENDILVKVAWNDAAEQFPVTAALFENDDEMASILVTLDGTEEEPWTTIFTSEAENKAVKIVDLPEGYTYTEADGVLTISAGEAVDEPVETASVEAEAFAEDGEEEIIVTVDEDVEPIVESEDEDIIVVEEEAADEIVESDDEIIITVDESADEIVESNDDNVIVVTEGDDTNANDAADDTAAANTAAVNSLEFFRLNDDEPTGKRSCSKNCVLPATGITGAIAPQPKSVNYSALGLSIELPSIGASADILEVPFTDDGYAVTWLGANAGLLEGSAMPGEGQTWIAAHNHIDADEYGPFVNIGSLTEGDRVFIANQNDGTMTVYEVYANVKVAADDVDSVYAAADEYADSLTLITCEDESVDGGYANRRVICAKPL